MKATILRALSAVAPHLVNSLRETAAFKSQSSIEGAVAQHTFTSSLSDDKEPNYLELEETHSDKHDVDQIIYQVQQGLPFLSRDEIQDHYTADWLYNNRGQVALKTCQAINQSLASRGDYELPQLYTNYIAAGGFPK